jgi:hypothetical protein
MSATIYRKTGDVKNGGQTEAKTSGGGEEIISSTWTTKAERILLPLGGCNSFAIYLWPSWRLSRFDFHLAQRFGCRVDRANFPRVRFHVAESSA